MNNTERKHTRMPFDLDFDAYDKVLVRNKDNEGWMARLYDIYLVGLGHGCQDGRVYSQCIKYDGNEDLLGTTRSK